MPGDFDVSDFDPSDEVVGVTALLNSVVIVTKKGTVWRMTPTLISPTWERLPNVPLA